MKRIELEVEHQYKNKFVGRHRLKEGAGLVVLGSSRDANIRLLGDEVAGIHAYLDYQNGVWTISDAGSEQGTWVKKKPIVTEKISSTTVVSIGGHHIKIIPRVIESNLFKVNHADKITKGGTVFHQVIVRRHGFVVESALLENHEEFSYRFKGQAHSIMPPKGHDWNTQEFGPVVIQNRLVNSDMMQVSSEDRMKALMDPSLRAPMGAALLMLLIMSVLIGLAPDKPDEDMVEPEAEKNRFTRIIYDAKSARKKRMASKKITTNIKKSSRVAPAVQKAVVKKTSLARSSGKAPKVISKIKSKSLSRLLGKISKRASKTATFITAKGVSPDQKRSGRSLASVGSVGGKTKKFGNGGKTFKVNGIGTAGKAGSNSSYKGTGGLAMGNIGSGSVGVIEEETEIQGGLDRDEIARVINAQLGEIRYCYERQLSASPDIYGKVLVKFTINGSGSVSSQNVGLSTLRSAMVEGCILRRVAGWRFPKPKGGTSVLVTYPFLFKSTN